jgi:ABC-type nitrate/sulfonate/bicarbonate transport system ATPase subunit
MNTPLPYSVAERLLTINDLHVAYERPVLSGVSECIDNIVREGMEQGQVVSLLGPSGVGKTQLFRCIAGLQRPTSGSVTLMDGKRQVSPGEVGVVAQNYPLLAHRTIIGNLMVAARRKSPNDKEARARAMAMLEKFGLADKATAYPAALSGGQRQRIAIAQQLLCSSHFLLMDEPFSGLDPLAKTKVCEMIMEISTVDELNTTIVISHDIEASVRIADTLWVLGRDFDENGQPKPGARIKFKYDLIAMGLAWHKDVDKTPEFFALCNELKERFTEL